MVKETRELLDLLGIDGRRLRWKSISASEGAAFAAEIRQFLEKLKELGTSSHTQKREFPSDLLLSNPMPAEQTVGISKEQIDYCMECGVCTGSCPVSRIFPEFSPRQYIKRVMAGEASDVAQNREIWACLSCARCHVRCPAEIDFPEFNRSWRTKAVEAGCLPRQSHHGILQTIAGLQTRNIRQQRTQWAKDARTFDDIGTHFYFTGCLPYFDLTLRYLNLSSLEIARSTLALLNRLGIEPVVSNNERCCGHDALWSGNETTFLELAQWNMETIKASGAETVLFGCPECYYTFCKHYPKYFGELPFEVLYITEFLASKLPSAGLQFRLPNGSVVTYQDPCRLGRRSGIYDSPRQLLKDFAKTDIVEMERNRENALCCGTSAWIECSDCSKSMQMERLNEAVQTGAEVLITSCPKCRIHLTCAQRNTDMALDVTDICSYLSASMIED